MSATQLTPGQDAFVSDITAKVGTALGSQLPGKFQMVAYPPGFHPAAEFGTSPPYYNSTMLDAFNGTLEIGSNGMLTLGNSQFATLYYNILRNATYQYSTADQKVINDPNIANQQIAVINTATSDGFAVTYGVSPVTYGSVIGALLKNFSQAPTDWSTGNISAAAANLPNAGFADLGQAIGSAAQQLSPLNTILGAQASANEELSAAMDHAQNPSATNGGMQTAAAAYYVGWTPMPTNNQIQGGLQGGSTVSIEVSASNFTSTTSSVSIAGKTGFSIPIFDIIDIGFGGSASYDWNSATSSSSSVSMSMEYTGVTPVQIDPMPLSADHKTGWYDKTLLQSIVKGSGDASVSGFKVDPSNQYAVANMFGPGKAFSRLKTVVICNAPTITMTFSADMASSVTSSFKQQASTSVKLFGIFSIGSASQSYSIDKVDTNSASGTVTVVMKPPAIVGTVPQNKQVSTILGGVADFPPPA